MGYPGKLEHLWSCLSMLERNRRNQRPSCCGLPPAPPKDGKTKTWPAGVWEDRGGFRSLRGLKVSDTPHVTVSHRTANSVPSNKDRPKVLPLDYPGPLRIVQTKKKNQSLTTVEERFTPVREMHPLPCKEKPRQRVCEPQACSAPSLRGVHSVLTLSLGKSTLRCYSGSRSSPDTKDLDTVPQKTPEAPSRITLVNRPRPINTGGRQGSVTPLSPPDPRYCCSLSSPRIICLRIQGH